MNAVKCPTCGNPNAADDNFCLNCGSSISILNQPPNTYSPLTQQQQQQPYQSYNFNVPSNFNMPVSDGDNRFGQNVYIAYKVFCGAMVLLSFLPIITGILALIGSSNEPNQKEKQDAINGAIFFILYGLLYLFPYGLGLILPKSRIHWFFAFALFALALNPFTMTACVSIPAAIAFMIFWFRPQTKAYFGWKY